MATWQPKWAFDPEPKPRTLFYDWLDENTGETLFSVEVDATGLIHVLEDDWLSKYTAALHGDFGVYERFIRVNPAQKTYDIIRNTDLIYEGEYILHVASFLAYDAFLKEAHFDDNEVADLLADSMQKLSNWTKGAVTLDAIGWALVFASVAPPVEGVLLAATLLVGLVSSMQDLADANRPELAPERLYAKLYTATAWVYDEASDTTTYPTTDEDLGEFNQYIPQLPYPVPRGVANPKSWFNIHDYQTKLDLGIMSVDSVRHKFALMKEEWENTSEKTISDLVQEYQEKTLVLAGGDPTMTMDEFKRQKRTVTVPGLKNRLTIEKALFFEKNKESLLHQLEKTWVGPSAPLRLVKALRRKYTSFYPVPK